MKTIIVALLIGLTASATAQFFAVNVAGLATRTYWMQLANNATQTDNGGDVVITNGAVFVNYSSQTNTFGAVRLMQGIGASYNGGSGTDFGQRNHILWIRGQFNARDNASFVAMVGKNRSVATNIGTTLTNRGFGFEIGPAGVDTNRIRLVAHDGATLTNGPWVTMGTVFLTHTIGVEQRTSGEVHLYLSSSTALPAKNTNASITGGPTNSPPALHDCVDVRFSSSATNSGGGGAALQWVGVEIVP